MKLPDPEIAPGAQRELRELGIPVGYLLHRWLCGLALGDVPAWKIRLLLGAPRTPPWQWAEYVNGIVVVFRFLSVDELVARSTQGPQLLIARITSVQKLAEVAADLLKDAP
jgi:hypothetical protein